MLLFSSSSLDRNIASVKWLSYAVVCLLNLNVMMSSFGKKHADRGYKSVYHGLIDLYYNGNPNPDYNVSLFITLAMGFVNVCGYITIASFLATTEVPLVVNLTDKVIKDAEYASPVRRSVFSLHILSLFFSDFSIATELFDSRLLISPSLPPHFSSSFLNVDFPPSCFHHLHVHPLVTAPQALPVSCSLPMVALGNCCRDSLHCHARRQLPRKDRLLPVHILVGGGLRPLVQSFAAQGHCGPHQPAGSEIRDYIRRGAHEIVSFFRACFVVHLCPHSYPYVFTVERHMPRTYCSRSTLSSISYLSYENRSFRNHVLLLACSVLGFFHSPFFSLLLLDIINNSSVLNDIMKSITIPLPALSMVLFTFIITVIVYAQFGRYRGEG